MITPFLLQVNNHSNNVRPYSDKAILPANILSEIINDEIELPHPLIFKITNQSDPFVYTYIGVKEFTSEPGEVILPSFVNAKLQNPTDVSLELERNIPKAISLCIKPKLFYANVKNWKFFLEEKLRDYTVVNRNDCVIIEDDGLKYELIVEQINGPDNVTVASIIDTDVTLDIVPLNDNVAGQQLEFNKKHQEVSDIHELELGQEVLIHDLSSFMLPEFVPQMYKVNIRKWNKPKLVIELEAGNLINADCVVGINPLVTIENHTFSTLKQDGEISEDMKSGMSVKKTIVVNFNDELILNKLNRCKQFPDEENEEYLYIVPFTWQGKQDITLRVIDQQDDRHEVSGDSIKCPKCFKLIPKDNFLLHETRCRKGNASPIDTKLMQFKHAQLYDNTYQCCSQNFDTFFDMVRHKSSCPKTLHECRFCHLIVPQELATYQDKFEDLTHHENMCGDKTDECYKCRKIVRRKDIAKHMKIHEMEKIDYNDAIIFNKCSNVNCSNESSGNTLGLCDLCFGPLYIAQNDPSNIKLQSRIERRYILQLTKGCGRSWCTNEYCATGNPKLNKSIKENTALMAGLFASIHQPRLPINDKNGISVDGVNKVWFCVNESVSNKKVWFDILKSDGNYTEAVILQALKLNKDELLARKWLQSNAIEKSL